MAVARITTSPAWFLATANVVKPSSPKTAVELVRAADRPGLTAEVDEPEIRLLSVLLPEDELISKALADLEECLVREAARTRGLRARMDLGRGTAGSF